MWTYTPIKSMLHQLKTFLSADGDINWLQRSDMFLISPDWPDKSFNE